MHLPLSVALEDPDFLREVCGPNDQNLVALEEYFGVPIRCRGNELLLDTEDEEMHLRFSYFIQELREQSEMGNFIDNSIIISVLENLNIPTSSSIKDDIKALLIPGGLQKIFARGIGQKRYLDALQKEEIVIAIGPAGTGKTFLAVAFALRAVISGEKKRLVITRPVVEAGENLGFLPGDLTRKIDPYLRPLYDSMNSMIPSESIKDLERTKAIEIAPLAYMRGRTLTNSYVILDEAQNSTKKQIKMFLTRLGEGSCGVITGDITQIDLPERQNSGLVHIMSVLNSVSGISFVYFDNDDVVRSPLVQRIVHAYEELEGS